MPSNNELLATALELAAGLGLEVKTEGLDNKGLNALVSDLKAKKKDADLKTEADAEALKAQTDAEALKAQTDAEALKADKRAPGVYVEQGKAVTSKIGILTEGAPVDPKFFVGGEETLQHLIDVGVCVEVK